MSSCASTLHRRARCRGGASQRHQRIPRTGSPRSRETGSAAQHPHPPAVAQLLRLDLRRPPTTSASPRPIKRTHRGKSGQPPHPGGRTCLARRRTSLQGSAQVRQRRQVSGSIRCGIDTARHGPRGSLTAEHVDPVDDERRGAREVPSLGCLVGVDDLYRELGLSESDVVQCRPQHAGRVLGPGRRRTVLRPSPAGGAPSRSGPDIRVRAFCVLSRSRTSMTSMTWSSSSGVPCRR